MENTTLIIKKYSFYNNLLGWIVFLIALFVYGSTIEPNASYWDCGEYIAAATKLEIAHSPGSCFFSNYRRSAIHFFFRRCIQASYDN